MKKALGIILIILITIGVLGCSGSNDDSIVAATAASSDVQTTKDIEWEKEFWSKEAHEPSDIYTEVLLDLFLDHYDDLYNAKTDDEIPGAAKMLFGYFSAGFADNSTEHKIADLGWAAIDELYHGNTTIFQQKVRSLKQDIEKLYKAVRGSSYVSSNTEKPKSTPKASSKPTTTVKTTAKPKSYYYGTWKSCGIESDGVYYTVEELESIGNNNITDFYNILGEKSAYVYIQGQEYDNVTWRTTEDGVVIGSNVMKLESGKLLFDYNGETLYFEKISTSQNKEDIKLNPYAGATMGQKSALDSAKAYLRLGGFSYEGLIKQLEYEKYTHEEAVFAADNCGADWKEQALVSAKNYIKTGGFSYKGLIKQLQYEQFTEDEAVYAADRCGANWNEQAVLSAQSYIKYSSFSKEGLIKQLEYEGFTHEQAVYAVEKVGY
jgi:hypothetical protein